VNINPKIEATFKDFTVDGEKISIAYQNYTGKATKYLTYYTWSELPKQFYDDFHSSEICYATIDLWSKGNFKNIVEKIKTTLFQNGFTWTDNASETFEQDTGYFHVPINFFIEREAIDDK